MLIKVVCKCYNLIISEVETDMAILFFVRNLVWNSWRHWNSFCHHKCICYCCDFRFYPTACLCLQIWTMCRSRRGWTKVIFLEISHKIIQMSIAVSILEPHSNLSKTSLFFIGRTMNFLMRYLQRNIIG